MSPTARLWVATAIAVVTVVAALGTVFSIPGIRQLSVSVLLLLGVGAAACLLLRPLPARWFALLSLATSLTVTMAVGFVLSIVHWWHSLPLFALTVVATAGAVIVAGLRDLAALRAQKTSMGVRTVIGWHSLRQDRAQLVVAGLTVLGLAVMSGTALVNRRPPERDGLAATLGVPWFVGLALVGVAVVWAQRRGRSPALPVLSLAGAVVLSQAITYGAPTVMSAARHVGFVEFIRATGGAQPSLDIYQAWSGLFAGIGWLCDAAGIDDPMIVATWWPVLLSVGCALAVTQLASRWIDSPFRAWLATLVFALCATTVNITYFSPQSLGFFLTLTILAVASGRGVRTRARRPRHTADADAPAPAVGPTARPDFRQRLVAAAQPLGWRTVAFVAALACVMAVSHQISPYLAVAALLVLAAFGFVRPWWLSIVVLAPALAWALINRGVLGGFVSLGAVGRFWDNAQPPVHSLTQFAQPSITRYAFTIPSAVLLCIGIVAVVQVLRLRSRMAWALAVVAASPASLVLATDYGQEGIFRVVLFACPWVAILACMTPWRWPKWSSAALAVAVAGMVAVNVFGQTALDWNRVVRQDTAEATRLYELTAPSDSMLLLTGTTNATPLGISARYLDVGYLSREALGDYPDVNQPYDAAADVETLTRKVVASWPSGHYYALVSDSIGAYDERYGYQYYAQYQELAAAMAASPYWEPIFSGQTTTLYRLKDLSAVPPVAEG
jgi:hypothetical protein